MKSDNMRIDDWCSASTYINCEFETLEFLRNKDFCFEVLPILAREANRYWCANYKRDRRLGFNFESNFNIRVDGKDGIAHIGSLIKMKDNDHLYTTSCFLAIRENDERKLLRKFHFDYAPSTIHHRQPHPVFHLQYAGTLTPMLRKEKIDDEHLFPKLSEPRLYYFPLSLALLINLILKEFPDKINRKLIERSEWRKLIKKNEDLILKPFFDRCQTFFSNKTDELFTNDFYYGN
jgi:hypothetical protein